MKTTQQGLLDRIADLERELEKYKTIASAYRAALGDVRANEILLPILRPKERHQPTVEEWMSAFTGR